MTTTKQIKLLNELIEKGDNPQRVIVEIYDYVADKDEKPREVITIQDYINNLKNGNKINTSDWKILYKHITSKQIVKYTKNMKTLIKLSLRILKKKQVRITNNIRKKILKEH